MQTFQHHDGLLLAGDANSRATLAVVLHVLGAPVPLIVADPPYGITKAPWDSVEAITGHKLGTPEAERLFVDWMLAWTRLWSEALVPGGAMYVWGGVGLPLFRPFYGYLHRVERETGLSLANHITWKKKRAYGVAHNYLFTREELAYLVKGDPKKPRCFHIPLTDRLRGYKGYDEKYAAKSDYLRRTNVWTEDGLPALPPSEEASAAEEYRMPEVWDETELLRGKRHDCEKQKRVNEIPIEVHTEPGETVIDLFSGSGSLSEAARRLGRKWAAIERDEAMVSNIDRNMRKVA